MPRSPTPYQTPAGSDYEIASGMMLVATVAQCPEAQDNRQFIITACNCHDDALEACRKALEAIDWRVKVTQKLNGYEHDARDLLRDVIRKAEGEVINA